MSMIVTGTVIAGASLGYTVYSTEEAKKKTRSQEDDANKQASLDRLNADNSLKLSNETEIQQKARARQRAMGAGLGTSTIMGGGMASTSGIGSTQTTTPAFGKTLLGS